ncbi:MAG: septum site-determining protein MinC [Sulfobacillus thermosulfidooxidans]|nr:MAG: septum site-determining protein MinC [Sulfobacillus thermosulfidooxidans]
MQIKGDRRGLRLLATGFTTEAALIEDLDHTLETRQEFLGTTGIFLEVGAMDLTPSLFEQVAQTFARFPALTLKGIQQSDTAVVISLEEKKPVPVPRIVRHTIRSGQQIMHTGDVIIVGDVNPGATIIASGDVMVFGWLRGTVYAGQPQDRTAGIFALRMQPTQIKIGDIMALGDGRGEEPEFAHVEEGAIVVQHWADVKLPDIVTQEPRTRRGTEKISRLINS